MIKLVEYSTLGLAVAGFFTAGPLLWRASPASDIPDPEGGVGPETRPPHFAAAPSIAVFHVLYEPLRLRQRKPFCARMRQAL